MNATELIVRFVAGGALVVAVTVVAHYSSSRIAGIVMLFPAITLASMAFLDPLNADMLKRLSLGGLIALPTTIGFLATIFICADKISVAASIALGVAVWLVIAILVAIIQSKALG